MPLVNLSPQNDGFGLGQVSKQSRKLIEFFFKGFGDTATTLIYGPESSRIARRIEKVTTAIANMPESIDATYEDEFMKVNRRQVEFKVQGLIPANDSTETPNHIMLQNIKHEFELKNKIGVLNKAAAKLEQVPEGEISDTPVDDRFAYNFLEKIKGIKDEEIQEIWASILAGEVKKPGSFSIRTLSVLENLSHEEAQIFVKISPMVFENTYLMNPGKLHDDFLFSEFNITHNDLMSLRDAGLLLSTTSGLTNLYQKGDRFFSLGTVGFNLKFHNIDTAFFPIISLTNAGKELHRLNNSHDEAEQLRYLRKFVTKHDTLMETSTYSIHVARKKTLPDGSYELEEDLNVNDPD